MWRYCPACLLLLLTILIMGCSGVPGGSSSASSGNSTVGRAPNRGELKIVISDVVCSLGYTIDVISPGYIRTRYRHEFPTAREEALGIEQKMDRLTFRFVRKAHNVFVAYLEPNCRAKFPDGKWKRTKASGKTLKRHQWLARQVRILLEPSMPQWTIH